MFDLSDRLQINGIDAPNPASHLFWLVLDGVDPDAVYVDATDSAADNSRDWSLWAVFGGAVLRVRVTEKQGPFRDVGEPDAVIFPLHVRSLTASRWDDAVVWTAVVDGPDGPLTIDLPNPSLCRSRSQREAAAEFAAALRGSMMSRG